MAATQDARAKSDDGIWETVKVIIQALLIAFVVRTFLYQPFNIPSNSMYPTLKQGDYLFVSKLSYGYSKYSFNFSVGFRDKTFFSCCSFINFPGRKFFADTPKRGDVAVFKLPSDTHIDYIKRVIGLPGDRVQMKGGVLYINDVAVKKTPVEPFIDPEKASPSEGGHAIDQYEETLPNGVVYRVLDEMQNGIADNTRVFEVPPDHYFMMGDNRDNSDDSRLHAGFIPIENFVGRADIIFFSMSSDATWREFWKWPAEIRWSRFLHLI